MQVELTQGRTMLHIWLGVSIVGAVLGHFVFFLWLLRRKVKMDFFWAGTPIYLEYIYYRWCKNQGREPSHALLLTQAFLLINLILAVVIAIPVLTAR